MEREGTGHNDSGTRRPFRLLTPDMPVPGLDHLALVAVTGADARAFLDAQLTRNVPDPRGAAGLAGYCSPKGRLLAIFTLWSDHDTIHLLTTRDVVEAIVRRLKMYVLRSKVAIEDVTAAHRVAGVIDASPSAVAPWTVSRDGEAVTVQMPAADGLTRRLCIDGSEPGVDAQTWRWSDIRAGLPSIFAATQDRFVPQMVNLEAIGGVDFKKGCFPGQEIVARSQYLGKLKRRVALLHSTSMGAAPEPGTDLWSEGANEPQGTVVDAARGLDDRISALVELPVALAHGALHAGTPDGPAFVFDRLPYDLPDNEVFARPKL